MALGFPYFSFLSFHTNNLHVTYITRMFPPHVHKTNYKKSIDICILITHAHEQVPGFGEHAR